MRILGAAAGNCIHTTGIINFLRLAESCGFETRFMGPAVPVGDIVASAADWKPDIIDLGYRLSPGTALVVIEDVLQGLDAIGFNGTLVFGGPLPVCREIRRTGRFHVLFDGSEHPEEPLRFIKGLVSGERPEDIGTIKLPDTLVDRIDAVHPMPLLRHHFGLPDLHDTFEGVARIAESGQVDIISIGPDQNAQEFFFKPHLMSEAYSGAGGAPIRSRGDLERIREGSQRGNKPLLRCYSGTNDQILWGGMLLDTISNAWAAIPLFWYSELDGRSTRPLEQAIRENQAAMAWHAVRGIPVEVNDPHHWSLRGSHDAIAVAVAYISAYNAKAMGVKTYVAQFMLNTPVGTSFSSDLGKMLAKLDLISGLEDGSFRVIRQTRAGLSSFSPDPATAKGQLAASTVQGLFLGPDIIHVVGFSEADHAATADDVIEGCTMVRGILKSCGTSLPDPALDPGVAMVRDRLRKEAGEILEAIGMDVLADPEILARAVRVGILDSPQFKGTGLSPGRLTTVMSEGGCRAMDTGTGRLLSERERLAGLPALGGQV